MRFYKKVVLFSSVVIFFSGCLENPSVFTGMKRSREGDRFFSTGDFDRAVEKWTESLLFKNNSDIYEKIVMVYIMKSDFDKAEEWTNKGLTCFPNNGNLSFNLALINYHKDDLDDAVNNLEKVFRLNSYYPNAHYLKGLIFEKKGDFISAKEEFIKEININPGSKSAWQKLRGFKDD